MDKIIQSTLYASRWVLAPLYLGLIISLLSILIYFYIHIIEIFLKITTIQESSLIINVLGLIDLSLIGGLVLMVMLSGYENFISKGGQESSVNRSSWLGKLDANSLKMKIAASIVAISSIHLLQIFMTADKIDNLKALTFIALHLTFVFSACLMGWLYSKEKQFTS